MTRRAFLATLGGATAAGLLGDAFVVEPCWLEVTHHEAPAPGVPPLTLALLADLHLQSVGMLEEDVAEAVHDARPDLVVLVGDSVDERGTLDELERFLSLLPREAETWATLGNWEHWAGIDLEALRSTYARAGVQLLVNESASLEKKGRCLHIAGFDDATAGRPRLGVLPQQPAAGEKTIALAHSPVYRDRLAALSQAQQPDLVLSGHTHGGQLDLLGWRPFLPRGSGRYVEGWYGRGAADAGPPLYVTRGIGTSVVPARLGARPEVALIQV